jgi:hypothetical protein
MWLVCMFWAVDKCFRMRWILYSMWLMCGWCFCPNFTYDFYITQKKIIEGWWGYRGFYRVNRLCFGVSGVLWIYGLSFSFLGGVFFLHLFFVIESSWKNMILTNLHHLEYELTKLLLYHFPHHSHRKVSRSALQFRFVTMIRYIDDFTIDLQLFIGHFNLFVIMKNNSILEVLYFFDMTNMQESWWLKDGVLRCITFLVL